MTAHTLSPSLSFPPSLMSLLTQPGVLFGDFSSAEVSDLYSTVSVGLKVRVQARGALLLRGLNSKAGAAVGGVGTKHCSV